MKCITSCLACQLCLVELRKRCHFRLVEFCGLGFLLVCFKCGAVPPVVGRVNV